MTIWFVLYAVAAVFQVSPAQAKLEQEREACRAEKAALASRMGEVFRDFEAVPAPARVDVLVSIDQRIRGLLQNRPGYRPCGTDRELIYDKRWDVMGVNLGYWEDLEYTGQLLVAAHRRNPNSAWRPHTLFSTVFGETPSHGLGVMPDIKAAHAYEAEFPSGPFITDVYRTIADFHKDLYMVLREGRRSGYKYDCFAPYIGAGPWRSQADRARDIALQYYQRVLQLTPSDARARASHEETRKGVVRGWSFCAD